MISSRSLIQMLPFFSALLHGCFAVVNRSLATKCLLLLLKYYFSSIKSQSRNRQEISPLFCIWLPSVELKLSSRAHCMRNCQLPLLPWLLLSHLPTVLNQLSKEQLRLLSDRQEPVRAKVSVLNGRELGPYE